MVREKLGWVGGEVIAGSLALLSRLFFIAMVSRISLPPRGGCAKRRRRWRLREGGKEVTGSGDEIKI